MLLVFLAPASPQNLRTGTLLTFDNPNLPAMKIKFTIQILLWGISLTAMTAPETLARHDQRILDREISIDVQNVPLAAALTEIEIAADVKFVYSGSQLDLDQPVTIAVRHKRLGLILNDLLGPIGIMYTVDREYILLKPVKAEIAKPVLTGEAGAAAEPFQAISGTVTDAATLQPIAGVNIIVKGTTSGTTTDSEGKYVIDAEEGDMLVFSFIGYRKMEVPVGGRMIIDVSLEEDVASLKEVVVNAGYYTVTDKTKTGNISKVTAKEIERQPVTSPLMALQGRVPGVDIVPYTGIAGEAPKIQIRGQNSLRFDGGYPLYVIDGVPVDSRPILSNSAVVTGSYDPLAALNPSNILSIEVLKDADATAIYGSRGANGVILITTRKGAAGKTSFDVNTYRGVGKVANRMDLLNTSQYLEMRKEAFRNNNNQVLTASNAPDLVVWDTTRYTDWQKVLLGNNADITDIQASISGGGSRTSFRFGGGYHKEGMIFPGDFGYERASGHFTLNHRSEDDKLSALLSANYGSTESNLFNDLNVVNDALRLSPNAPAVFDEEGKLNWEPYGTATFNSTWKNPLAGFRKTNEATAGNLVVNSTLGYEIFSGLTLKASMGYTDLLAREVLKTPIAAFDPNYASVLTAESRFGNTSRRTWIVEPQVMFAREEGHHTLDAVVGATGQEAFSAYQYIGARGYSSDALLGSMNGATEIFVNDDESSRYRYTAIFARIGYDWKDKYFLNLTGRRDGSSRFGPENRFGNFGAIGAAWIFSNEPVIQNNLSFLSFGKIRGSLGTTGNDQIGEYRYLNTYSPTEYKFISQVGLTPTALYNPDYAWEITQKLEAALELNFFDDRISMEAVWYRNRSSNQLVNYQLPSTTGFNAILSNLGATVENKGWEFVLSTVNINTTRFRWTTSGNISIPRNELIAFPDLANSSYASQYIVGEPLSIQKLYTATGVDSQTGLYEFLDVNNDARINTDDRTFIYDTGRKFFGGISNTFVFRSFELSFLVQFVNQLSREYTTGVPGQRANLPAHFESERWRKEGDIATVQKVSTGSPVITPYANYTNSSGRLRDGSFTRLKTLAVSYSLPEDLSEKIRAQSCKFYFQGQNLYTLTDFTGLDPETGTGSVPLLKIMTFGFQIQF